MQPFRAGPLATSCQIGRPAIVALALLECQQTQLPAAHFIQSAVAVSLGKVAARSAGPGARCCGREWLELKERRSYNSIHVISRHIDLHAIHDFMAALAR